MEQRLAEFRARRQAENAARKDESAAPQCRGHTGGDTAAQTDAATAESPQAEERTEDIRDSTPRKVRHQLDL